MTFFEFVHLDVHGLSVAEACSLACFGCMKDPCLPDSLDSALFWEIR